MNTDQAALLQFLGTFHAQAKETEKQIVDMKSGIRPISESIKEKFAQVLSAPAQTFSLPQIDNTQPVIQQQPQVQQPQLLDPTQLELNLFNPPVNVPYNNDRVIELLSKINSNIERLCTILTKNECEEKSKSKKSV